VSIPQSGAASTVASARVWTADSAPTPAPIDRPDRPSNTRAIGQPASAPHRPGLFNQGCSGWPRSDTPFRVRRNHVVFLVLNKIKGVSNTPQAAHTPGVQAQRPRGREPGMQCQCSSCPSSSIAERGCGSQERLRLLRMDSRGNAAALSVPANLQAGLRLAIVSCSPIQSLSSLRRAPLFSSLLRRSHQDLASSLPEGSRRNKSQLFSRWSLRNRVSNRRD